MDIPKLIRDSQKKDRGEFNFGMIEISAIAKALEKKIEPKQTKYN